MTPFCFPRRPPGSVLYRLALADATLILRRASPNDAAAERDFIAGLSRESRYYRFLSGGRVADEVLASLLAAPVSLVVTTAVEGEERIVANGHYVVGEAATAELAVAVADCWQGRGIGRLLVRWLVDTARRAGLRGLRGDVLSENRRMLALLRDQGFSARRNPMDALLHEASLTFATELEHVGGGSGLAPAGWLPEDWFDARETGTQ